MMPSEHGSSSLLSPATNRQRLHVQPTGCGLRVGQPLRSRFAFVWARRTFLAACLAAIACVRVLGADAPIKSENFRIDNEVFSDGQKEPTARSTTIFCDGIVYDYLETPEETVIFDKASRRFVLLDGRRRVRTELTSNAILTFTERLKEDAQKQQDPLLKFLAAPKLDEKFDADTRELTLSSRWLTYRLRLEDAESEVVAQQVREFSDWFAQLNTLLNPGARLPFARMLVDEALANRQAVPREVYLTISSGKKPQGKPTAVHSRHRLSRELTQSDLGRVAQTRQLLDVFKQVSFDEYRKTGRR